MEVIEQETQVLHGKIKTLESENEKMIIENKKYQLLSGAKKVGADKTSAYIEKIAQLETQLAEANKKLEGVPSDNKTTTFDATAKKKLKDEVDKLKETLKKVIVT